MLIIVAFKTEDVALIYLDSLLTALCSSDTLLTFHLLF